MSTDKHSAFERALMAKISYMENLRLNPSQTLIEQQDEIYSHLQEEEKISSVNISSADAVHMQDRYKIIYAEREGGLGIVAFQDRKTKRVTVAFDGTDLTEWEDAWQDIKLVHGSIDPGDYAQAETAIQHTEAVLALDGVDGPVDVVGHSLGGFIALMVKKGMPDKVDHVTTFNAPSIGGIVGSLAEEKFKRLLVVRRLLDQDPDHPGLQAEWTQLIEDIKLTEWGIKAVKQTSILDALPVEVAQTDFTGILDYMDMMDREGFESFNTNNDAVSDTGISAGREHIMLTPNESFLGDHTIGEVVENQRRVHQGHSFHEDGDDIVEHTQLNDTFRYRDDMVSMNGGEDWRSFAKYKAFLEMLDTTYPDLERRFGRWPEARKMRFFFAHGDDIEGWVAHGADAPYRADVHHALTTRMRAAESRKEAPYIPPQPQPQPEAATFDVSGVPEDARLSAGTDTASSREERLRQIIREEIAAMGMEARQASLPMIDPEAFGDALEAFLLYRMPGHMGLYEFVEGQKILCQIREDTVDLMLGGRPWR